MSIKLLEEKSTKNEQFKVDPGKISLSLTRTRSQKYFSPQTM